MAQPHDEALDAMTEGDVADTAASPQTDEEQPVAPKKSKNAFSELMSPKPKREHSPQPTNPPITTDLNAHFGRHALAAYTLSPTSFPPTRVLSHSPSFVTIHDLFPKSTIHLLLLPRDPAIHLLHPFTALSHPPFLAAVRAEASILVRHAASELRRRFSHLSVTDAARNAALSADPPPAILPQGRDWEKEIMVGVHAHPSMAHLHIHVLSVDRVSECMKHRKHYNSFATPFFVRLEEFPLAEGDRGRGAYLENELVCWRCGRGFGRGFARLKRHLQEEFEGWKRV